MPVSNRTNFILKFVFVCISLVLSGCAHIGTYTASPHNVVNIREARNNILLGEFTGGTSSVSCRAVFLYANYKDKDTEKDNAYALYIRRAFESELASAGKKPGLPSSKVSLKLLNIDANCGIIPDAFWMMEAEVTVEGYPPFIVRTQRNFEFAVNGDQIVENASGAFPSAVQSFIGDIITHPTFRSALNSPRRVQ